MWTDDDQDKVAAWLRSRREVCPSCGTVESDWLDSEHYPLDTPKWEATTYRCPGCAEMHITAKEIPDGESGVRVVLVPFVEDEDTDDEDDE